MTRNRLFIAASSSEDTRLFEISTNALGANIVSEKVVYSYAWAADPDNFPGLQDGRNVRHAVRIPVVSGITYVADYGLVGVVKNIQATVRRTGTVGNFGPVQVDYAQAGIYFEIVSFTGDTPTVLTVLPSTARTVNATATWAGDVLISWYDEDGSGHISKYSPQDDTLINSHVLSQRYLPTVLGNTQYLNHINNIQGCHLMRVNQRLLTCGNGERDALETCELGAVQLCAELSENWSGGLANCRDDCLGYDTDNCRQIAPFQGRGYQRTQYGYCPPGWGVGLARGEDFSCARSAIRGHGVCIVSARKAFRLCKKMDECHTVDMIDPHHPWHAQCGANAPCAALRKLHLTPHQQWRTCVKPERICPRTTKCRHQWGTTQLDGANTCACLRKQRVARKPLIAAHPRDALGRAINFGVFD